MWEVRRIDDDVHVLPVADDRMHAISVDCWCSPSIEHADNGNIIIHHAKDNRMLHECALAFLERSSDN